MTSVETAVMGVKTISALAVVLGVLIAAAFIARRFMSRNRGGSQGDMIQVLASRYIGPKNSILVIQVLERLLVVAVSGSQLSLLCSMDDVHLSEAIRMSTEGIGKESSFLKHLSRHTSRMIGRPLTVPKDEGSNA